MLDLLLKRELKSMKMEFERTEQTILHLSKQMSDIHEMYPGKENQKLRENLLKPYRDCCKVLHYERIKLNREG